VGIADAVPLAAPLEGDGVKLTRRYLVSGRVQGVGFRYFVERESQRLGVTGFASNLDDTRVEVQAQGTAAQLADLEGALHTGPRMARVTGIETSEIAPGDWTGFRIR
jgi:acylphosphatase